MADRRLLVLLLFVSSWLVGRGAEGAQEDWITQKDKDALVDAKDAVQLYCGGSFKGDLDREAGRKSLLSAIGGENLIQDILTESKDQKELSKKASEKLIPAWLVMKVGAIVFAFFLIILWWFCCWSCCPCCKCCRCGAKRRETGKICKGILVVIGAALTFCVIFTACYGRAGFDKCVDGFDNMSCTSAKLLDGVLGGQENPSFIGLMPLLEEFQQIEDSLAHNSTMMSEVRQALNATQEVANSMYLASQALQMLRDALTTNFPADVDTNHHVCHLCDTLGPLLAAASKALDEGAASALKEARGEIERQLSPENSAMLQDTFSNAAGPIVEVKETIRDTFGFFTDTDKFMQIRGQLAGKGPNTVSWLTLIIIIFALLVLCCMDVSCLACVFKETAGPPTVDGGQRYSKIPHRCACITWCFGWWFMVFAFFVGGLMSLVGVPLGGICIVMDDLSAQLLSDIGPAIGLNFTGDTGTQLLDIVSNCIVPLDPNLNAALLDLIYVRDNETAPKETLRVKIVDKVKNEIRSKFDDIDRKIAGGGGVSLSTNPDIAKLLKTLENSPMSMMILADDLSSDPLYQALYSQSSLAVNAVPSSVQCGDAVVSPEIEPLAGKTVYGVEAFVSALTSYGRRQTVRLDCADKVDCTDTVGSVRGQACQAANRLVELKQNIMDLSTFRCDIFESPSGAGTCDIKDMTGAYINTLLRTEWSNDCLAADAVTRKVVPCNLARFTTYIRDFSPRINNTMKRIDLAVAEVGPVISRGLRNVVEEYLITPIDTVADGVTCGLMGDFYREIVDGFCYQGVRGFIMIGESYCACGILTVIVVLVAYIVWRRAIDNFNSLSKTLIVEVGVTDTTSVVPFA